MPKSGVFVDASLLVLLVVGLADKDLISKHKRLKWRFDTDDYELLRDFVNQFPRVFVTPNTLTEASNLLAQHGEPQRSRILGKLADLIAVSQEAYVESRTACRNKEFCRLGLTDAALLEEVSPDKPLLTVDVDLYYAALGKDSEAGINFEHMRFA
jgi:hypothetical protein